MSRHDDDIAARGGDGPYICGGRLRERTVLRDRVGQVLQDAFGRQVRNAAPDLYSLSFPASPFDVGVRCFSASAGDFISVFAPAGRVAEWSSDIASALLRENEGLVLARIMRVADAVIVDYELCGDSSPAVLERAVRLVAGAAAQTHQMLSRAGLLTSEEE